MFITIVFGLVSDRPSGLLFFCTRFVSFRLFLPSSPVSLSYIILAVPMRECLGKQSCMSSQIFYSHTEWYLLFSRGKIVLAMAEASLIRSGNLRCDAGRCCIVLLEAAMATPLGC